MPLPSHHAASPALPAPRDTLCLDFANTLSWRGSATPTEALAGYDALTDWLANAGYPATTAATAWASRHPKRATRLFAEAIGLRETIFRCASAIAAHDAVPAADLDSLNHALAAAPPRHTLAQIHDRYGWSVAAVSDPAPVLLAPVLWSAADLLARADQIRVRRCANEQCLWLFIDHSKTGTRRWCDMAACGNRAKARRHYRLRQGAAAPTPSGTG